MDNSMISSATARIFISRSPYSCAQWRPFAIGRRMDLNCLVGRCSERQKKNEAQHTMMEYSDCREAIHTTRLSCDVMTTQQERDECRMNLNVHTDANKVSCRQKPLQCNISGDSQARYACCPNSVVPQTVYGTQLFGKTSRMR